jgi:hypothetical protein
MSWIQAKCIPSLSRAFQRRQEHDLRHAGSVDLITAKQNKLPSFIDRCSARLNDFFFPTAKNLIKMFYNTLEHRGKFWSSYVVHTYIHSYNKFGALLLFNCPATLNSRQDACFKAGGSLIHEVCMYNTQLWGVQVKLGDFCVSIACNHHHLQTTHMQSCLDLDMKDSHTILVSVWHTA